MISSSVVGGEQNSASAFTLWSCLRFFILGCVGCSCCGGIPGVVRWFDPALPVFLEVLIAFILETLCGAACESSSALV